MDFDGQEKLKASRVLIVGLGGLAKVASQYLASAGVGHLTLVDLIWSHFLICNAKFTYRCDYRAAKGESAKARLAAINPNIQIETINQRCSDEQLAKLIANVDLVLDCTDNVTVRNQLNLQCFKQKRPLASVWQFDLKGR